MRLEMVQIVIAAAGETLIWMGWHYVVRTR